MHAHHEIGGHDRGGDRAAEAGDDLLVRGAQKRADHAEEEGRQDESATAVTVIVQK
jgi:hypothetical protein